jgi:putative Mn2+ efflux pump MntP
MDQNRARWDKALDALEALHKDVERRSFSLPMFSLSPLMIGWWNFVKFYVCLLLDIMLFLPMNAIIFVRNLFPGRWRYRSFSGSYWKYVISWLWRGEAPAFPFGVIRALVTFMEIVHVYSRFRTIERCIYLDDTLTEEDRSDLNKKVAAALEHWRRPTMVQVVYSYVLPVVGVLITVYKSFFPSELPQWVGFVGLSLLGYAITFVISAFMFKRSLMLGASGRAIYFPGAIWGNQGYGKEREILDSVGIKTREWPFEIVLGFVWLAISLASFRTNIKFYESLGMSVGSSSVGVPTMLVEGGIDVMLTVLVLYRRRIAGRS